MKWFKKCVFCRKKKNNLLYIKNPGMYSDTTIAYHFKCLDKIACEPENYTNRQVDMVIKIVDLIKDLKTEEAEEKAKQKKLMKESCEYIKQQYI